VISGFPSPIKSFPANQIRILPQVDRKVTPRASIVLVNHNKGEQIFRCLQSLGEASTADIEIILVDNASSDGSAGRVATEFPEIHLVRCPTNIGFGAGNNLGASLAKGEYLAFLNPDTVVEQGWLEALIKALEGDPQLGLVTSKILLLQSPDQINTCGNDVHISGLTLCRGMGKPRSSFNLPEEVAAVSGAAFVIRRALFEALGGFDADFFLYMEDTDLSWRARLIGYRILYVPGSLVYHDYFLRFTPRKTFYQERNRYLMLLKCLKWQTLLTLLPALLLAELVTWGFELVHDRRNLANKFRAYIWIARNWKTIQEKRNHIKSIRMEPDQCLLRNTQYRLGFEQTGNGWIARLAHLVFDPLFCVLRIFILVLIRW
jgi:GT2 family glycosyltransferase